MRGKGVGVVLGAGIVAAGGMLELFAAVCGVLPRTIAAGMRT